MKISHYKRSTLFLGLALLVLLVGFGTGWFLAQERTSQRDAALVETEQAKSNEQVAKDYLESVCESGIRSACHMLKGIEELPAVQDPEIQESEVQEPEIQDPEVQEPDTFCRDNTEQCRGESGRDGRDGKQGPSGESIIGPVGPEGPAGEAVTGPQGPAGADGQNATPEMVANAVTDYCSARDECRGPKGDTGATGDSGPAGQSAFPFSFVFVVPSELPSGEDRTYSVSCTSPSEPCTVTRNP